MIYPKRPSPKQAFILITCLIYVISLELFSILIYLFFNLQIAVEYKLPVAILGLIPLATLLFGIKILSWLTEKKIISERQSKIDRFAEETAHKRPLLLIFSLVFILEGAIVGFLGDLCFEPDTPIAYKILFFALVGTLVFVFVAMILLSRFLLPTDNNSTPVTRRQITQLFENKEIIMKWLEDFNARWNAVNDDENLDFDEQFSKEQKLGDELEAFCKSNSLPVMSADDLLVLVKNGEILEHFIK